MTRAKTDPVPIEQMPALMTLTQLGQVMARGYHWTRLWAEQPDFPFEIREIGRIRYVSRREVELWLEPQQEAS